MSFIKKFQGQYQELWEAIIRPPRDEYELDQLGSKKFKIQNKNYQRIDITLKNNRKQNLQCSWFTPLELSEAVPCVMYLHGNCSSRLEALSYLDLLLPLGITLFCFDFAGSGKSDGEYISLGYYERYDIEAIIAYLRSTGQVSTIGLWGRSMGAATALMFIEMDQSIAGIVVDSAFASLRQLAGELSKMFVKRLPGFVVGAGLKILGVTIKKKAKFNLSELRPIAHVKKETVQLAFVPALFIAATEDTFIDPKHTNRLHTQYAGEKQLMMVEGDHNSPRPQQALDAIAIFFFNVLQCHQLNGNKSTDFMAQQFQKLGLTSSHNDKPNNQIDDDNENSDEEDEEEWQGGEDFDQQQLQLAIQQSLKESQTNPEFEEDDFFSSILACQQKEEHKTQQNEQTQDDDDDIFSFFDNSKTPVPGPPKQQVKIMSPQPHDIEDLLNLSPKSDKQEKANMNNDLLSFDLDEKSTPNANIEFDLL